MMFLCIIKKPMISWFCTVFIRVSVSLVLCLVYCPAF